MRLDRVSNRPVDINEEQQTIVATKNKPKNRLKTEQIQEIPRKTRHPSHVQITGHDTGLEHRLEADGERERQFHYSSQLALYLDMQTEKHTDDESGEESIDPTHDQSLRDHHHHIPLHHAHHGLHAGRVGHGIRRRLTPTVGILQKCAALERRDEVAFTHLEGFFRENGAGVVTQVDASDEGEAFARLGERRRRLWRCIHQDGRIVAEDTCQDLKSIRMGVWVNCERVVYHDNGDREQDPITGFWLVLSPILLIGTHNRAGSRRMVCSVPCKAMVDGNEEAKLVGVVEIGSSG